MKKQEFITEQFGLKIIVRPTAKGWICEKQSPYGWHKYYLPSSYFGADATPNYPKGDREALVIANTAQSSGKDLGQPSNRGTLTKIKDAFGNECVAKL